MDKIKLGVFDIFVYILPGSIILLSLDLILHQRNDFIEFLFNKAETYTLFQVIIILTVCFLLGFINQFLAYENFKIMSKMVWKTRLKNKEPSFGKVENKIVMIRHFSLENFNALNTWLAFRGMCYSLYQALVFLFIILIIRAFQSAKCTNQQILEIGVVFISAILFLRRSVTFHEWAHGTIENTYLKIDEFKPR